MYSLKLLITLGIVLLCSYYWAAPAQAETVVFTEDFSQGLFRWQVSQGSGWQIVNGRAEMTLNQAQSVSEIVPRDKYWDDNWKDYEYSLDYTPLLGIDRNISFNVQNPFNWYEVHFVDTFLHLVRVENHHQPFTSFHPYVMENGRTYRIRIRFIDGLIQVFANQVLIAQDYDATFNDRYGKIGIKITTGEVFPTKVQFDNIQVKLLDANSTQLPVPHFKQDDPRWGQSEYDTAHLWASNYTMSRWGCALTSAVMVLRYHGITRLPNNQDLTPLSLNQWLLNQADGYVSPGLVNWLAITRLTRLVSHQLNSPKLEFSRVAQNLYQTAAALYAVGEPVIFEVPGHFVVGTGILDNQNDSWILDPLYPRTKLSQHSGGPLSLRRLKPSQTDLSYIQIASTAPITMFLTDADHQFIPNVESYSEYLGNSEDATTSPTVTFLTLDKPSSQTYHLYIFPGDNLEYSLTIYEYDTQANVSQETFTGVAGTEGRVIPIEYEKVAPAPPTWQDFQALLQDSYDQQYISRYLSFFRLNRVINYAIAASTTDQIRYTHLCFYLLDLFKDTYDTTAWEGLRTLLLDLQSWLIATQSNS